MVFAPFSHPELVAGDEALAPTIEGVSPESPESLAAGVAVHAMCTRRQAGGEQGGERCRNANGPVSPDSSAGGSQGISFNVGRQSADD